MRDAATQAMSDIVEDPELRSGRAPLPRSGTARWLCCPLLTYRPGYSSSLAPRQRAWGPAAKCEVISARALSNPLWHYVIGRRDTATAKNWPRISRIKLHENRLAVPRRFFPIALSKDIEPQVREKIREIRGKSFGKSVLPPGFLPRLSHFASLR